MPLPPQKVSTANHPLTFECMVTPRTAASKWMSMWCDVHFLLNTRENWVERTIMATHSLLVFIAHSLRMVLGNIFQAKKWPVTELWHPPPSIPTCIQFSALVTKLMHYGKASITHPKRDWRTQSSQDAPHWASIPWKEAVGSTTKQAQHKFLRPMCHSIYPEDSEKFQWTQQRQGTGEERGSTEASRRMLEELLAKQRAGSGHADKSNPIGSHESRSHIAPYVCIDMHRI